MALLDARRSWQHAAGAQSELLTPRQVWTLEPRLSRRVRGGVLFPLDARLDNASLTRAFAGAAAAAGCALREGTDVKYGARHLKRAIERSVVHPMSNLIATTQVRTGDLLKIDFDPAMDRMIFFKEAEDVPAYALAQLVGATITPFRNAAGVEIETHRVVGAKTSRGR
jgi:hypothetical protein